jgi:hypothetical protein
MLRSLKTTSKVVTARPMSRTNPIHPTAPIATVNILSSPLGMTSIKPTELISLNYVEAVMERWRHLNP